MLQTMARKIHMIYIFHISRQTTNICTEMESRTVSKGILVAVDSEYLLKFAKPTAPVEQNAIKTVQRAVSATAFGLLCLGSSTTLLGRLEIHKHLLQFEKNWVAQGKIALPLDHFQV